MKHLKSPNSIIVIVLLAIASVLILSRAWGVPLEDLVFGMFVYTFYGLLILGYLLRFVLIFVGVFAFYRIIQQRFDKQLAV